MCKIMVGEKKAFWREETLREHVCSVKRRVAWRRQQIGLKVKPKGFLSSSNVAKASIAHTIIQALLAKQLWRSLSISNYTFISLHHGIGSVTHPYFSALLLHDLFLFLITSNMYEFYNTSLLFPTIGSNIHTRTDGKAQNWSWTVPFSVLMGFGLSGVPTSAFSLLNLKSSMPFLTHFPFDNRHFVFPNFCSGYYALFDNEGNDVGLQGWCAKAYTQYKWL